VLLVGVQDKPLLSISAPPPWSESDMPWVPMQTPITLGTNAQDMGATVIESVEFLLDNLPTPIATTSASANYQATYTFEDISAGPHKLKVRLTADGIVTESDPTDITLNPLPIVDAGPASLVSAPANGSNYVVGEQVTLTAKVTDQEGGVGEVHFYDDTDQTSPICSKTVAAAAEVVVSCVYALPAGTHRFSAQGIDSHHAVGRITPFGNTVVVAGTPVVLIVKPIAGSTFRPGESVTIEATATDSDGVQRVEFFADGTSLGTPDTDEPYAATWTATSVGTHTLSATAYDTANSFATAQVSVQVAERIQPIEPPVPPLSDLVSDSVGATAAEFRVDESGAATYRVPIYTPPGRAGVAPQIALAYSSQAGVGPLGKGWSIAGTSSIARCRATTEAGDPESALGPVDLTVNDRFCLDGQRLLEVSDSPACANVGSASARQFRTEIDSFQRVCAYTFDTAFGPRFFTVERKDGSKSWYGDRRSASSAPAGEYTDGYVANQYDVIYAWAQTRLQDSVGNFMDLSYLKGSTAGVDLGEHLLWHVAYTGKVNSSDGVVSGTFASIEFEYESTSRTNLRYFAGNPLYSKHRLKSVASKNGATVLRKYDLTYEDELAAGTYVPSGSNDDRLTAVQECRPRAGSADVCLPATTFDWSEARFGFSAPTTAGILKHGRIQEFEGMKFADIDGDGRQDLLWMKDDDQDGSCSTERLHVLLARTVSGQARFAPISNGDTNDSYCIADELPDDTSSGWFLLDYDGDGREDLFLREATPTSQKWRGYRATGQIDRVGTAFDFTSDLIAGIDIPARDSHTKPQDQPQLADFNGDGLMDIVYPKFGATLTLHARLMERGSSGFAWGAERALDLFGDGSGTTQTPCNYENASSKCTFKLLGLYRQLNYKQLTDFDADGRSDLLVQIEPTSACESGEGYEPPPGSPWDANDPWDALDPWVPIIPNSLPPTRGGAGKCLYSQVYTYAITGVSATTIEARQHGANRPFFSSMDPYDHPYNPSSGFRVSLADVNGDGMSDAVFTGTPTAHPTTLLNTGTEFEFAPVNSNSDFASPEHTQILDVNGDGRADLVYPEYVGGAAENQGHAHEYFVVRHGLAEGGFGAERSLTQLVTDCVTGDPAARMSCLTGQSFMFGDYDSDGAVDYLRIEWKESGNSPMHLALAVDAHKPRDVIDQITNGLGAVTQLTYLPMTNRAVYRRATGSRNIRDINSPDRSSPIADLLAPMYLVSRAESSAPTALSNTMARIDYRYYGLRVQAGGRGSLGFDQIQSIDASETAHHVVTTTRYAYKFPYMGLPLWTTKRVVSGVYGADDCFDGIIDDTITNGLTDSCFLSAIDAASGFPDVGGTLVSHSSSEWESAHSATASGPRPWHVRLAGSEDKIYDLASGDLLTRVVNSFKAYDANGTPSTGYDAYGNVTDSRTQTFGSTGAAKYTVTTDNTYTDNAIKWHLGRLTTSTVTHQRPNTTNPTVQDSVTRRSDFAYDPTTGLLTMEESQRGVAAENLRTFYVLNEYGMRERTHTCSSNLSEAECKATAELSSFQFQPQDSTSRIQRYVRQSFDATGRYVDHTTEPFNTTGGQEWDTLKVLDRDLYGNVIDVLDINGVRAQTAHGFLGRPYYAWTQTAESGHGVASKTTYRWCDGEVPCPSGAKYREEQTRTGAPKQWTYYDALARPVFSMAETFNAGIAGKDLSGVCTIYDVRGRAAKVTVPTFMTQTNGVPDFSCTTHGIQNGYDALGRLTLTTNPDLSTQQTTYSGLSTTITDALAKSRTEVRNPLGELASSTDAGGLTLTYTYNATGNATSIARDAGRGEINSTAVFDASGRKTSQADPDAGSITFTYNALGEVLTQTRTGSHTKHTYDARGRLIRRDVDGVETGFEYDTLLPGALRREYNLAVPTERLHEHDGMGRVFRTNSKILGTSHLTQVNYDNLGRPWKQQDASGRWLKTEYTARGFAHKVCESESADATVTCTGQIYLQTLETDARGNVVKEQRGGTTAMTVTRSYDFQTGRLLDLSAGAPSGDSTDHAIYHERYQWDAAGNLEWRDKAGQYKESFKYDDLHRLTKGFYSRLLNQGELPEAQAPVSLELFYDKLGNICRRTIGTLSQDYGYAGLAGCGHDGLLGIGTSGAIAGASPHAVTSFGGRIQSYDPLGNQTYASYGSASTDRSIEYTDEQQVSKITKGNKVTRFWYGTDGQRVQREDDTAGVKETTQYLGSVEVVTTSGQTKIRRYVAGVAVQEIVGPASASPSTSTKYLFHDHLGSVVRATSPQGGVLEGMDFGPFGERRGYSHPQLPASTPLATNRGFTSHEMLDGLDVVHMNPQCERTPSARQHLRS